MRTLLFSFLISLAILPLSSWTTPEAEETNEINWVSFEEAIKLNEKKPKKIIIDLYTDWCGWCKKMDRDTYARQEIIDYVNENYYAVKFDAEQQEEVFFQDHTFKFVQSGRRGYHELAAALTQNKLSYPTTVFMTESMEIIQPIPGYLDATTFDTIMRYIGEDHFKKSSWEDFQKNYTSKL